MRMIPTMGAVEMLVILVVVLLPLLVAAAAAVLLIWIVKRPGRPAPGVSAHQLSRPARDSLLLQRREQQDQEEQRIQKLLDSGRISQEEAAGLLNAMRRKTNRRACPFCSEDIQVEALKCPHCGEFLVQDLRAQRRRLTRSRERMLAGVCGGLAVYAGVDPSLVRVLTLVATVMTGFLSGIVLYVIAALIMPEPAG